MTRFTIATTFVLTACGVDDGGEILDVEPGAGLPAGDLPLEQAPPPGYLLQATKLVRGMPFLMYLSNADPSVRNYIVSGRPVANGDCPPPLGGACLEIRDPVIRYSNFPNPNGTMAVLIDVPQGQAGFPYGIHAVNPDPSPAEVSPAVIDTALGFSPENKVGNFGGLGGATSSAPNILFGSRQMITQPFVITGLGVRGYGSFQGYTLAVYTDDGGRPGSLVATATGTGLHAGENAVPIAPTPIIPGGYWLMGNFEVTSSIGYLGGGPTPVVYLPLPFGDPVPDPFPQGYPAPNEDYNFYLVGY